MTVTTEDGGRQNMFAKEPQMYVSKTDAVFMPALQNTKGRMVGYKDHKTYGDSTIYELDGRRPTNENFYLTLQETGQ
jgi:hypothetical protein